MQNLLDSLPKLKGVLTIEDINHNILYQKENAIQAYALTAMSNMLAGNIGYNPKSIKVWLSGTNIASSLITYTVVDATPWVKFYAFFDAPAFSGPMDEATLECIGGRFSQVTGISFTKPADKAIYITWQIIPS